MTDPRLDDLLERWSDLRRRGGDLSAEELCQDCPDLTTEMRKRIKALMATEWLERPLENEADRTPEFNPTQQTPEAFGLPQTLGRYRLEELIGVGGFGQVWRGFDPQLCRAVAIKIARLEGMATPGQMERFLAEGRKVAQLRHPGIVPVYDVGQEVGRVFIVSEFIEGGNLAAKLAQARQSPDDAARLVADVADALHHAHDRHIIHRDIKPSNILLDEGGKPFVADFGIALRTDEDRAAGQTNGTVAYMSPEQVRGGPLDVRTDIYSLGIVLYELLTGRVPSAASNLTVLREAIRSGKPAIPPRVLNSSVPVRLERICLKAMAKDATSRYPSAQEFAADLRAVAVVTRRKGLFIWGFIALLTVLGGLVGWFAAHAHRSGVNIANASLAHTQDNELRSKNNTAPEQRILAEVRMTPEAEALMAALNTARQTKGLRPLSYNSKLAAAAQFHATWLGNGGTPGHLEGEKPNNLEDWRASDWHPLNRMIHAGYVEFGVLNTPAANGHAGELIAYRRKNSPADDLYPVNIAATWLQNESESTTVLGTYQDIGIGMAPSEEGLYWVAVFGNP